MTFHCDVLKCDIKKPCELKSCRFNIKHPYVNNCLLQYSTEGETPNIAEFAFFYSKPIEEVRNLYHSAIKKLYFKLLKREFKEEMGVDYLPSDEICMVCESIAEDPVYIRQDHVLCKACLKHPTQVWQYALDSHTTVDDFCETLFSTFKRDSFIDRFLDFPKGTAKKLRLLRSA